MALETLHEKFDSMGVSRTLSWPKYVVHHSPSCPWEGTFAQCQSDWEHRKCQTYAWQVELHLESFRLCNVAMRASEGVPSLHYNS